MGQIERLIEAVTVNKTAIEAVETDIEALLDVTSLIKTSTEGGTQKLTIPADPFQIAGSAQVCRSMLVMHSNENPVYINIGAVATADNFSIPKDTIVPVPFDNCSKLNFFGTANDIIRIFWRN